MYTKEESMDYHRRRPEILEALANGNGFDVRYSDTLKDKRAYYAKVLKNFDGTEYIIRTSLNYESDW